MGMFYGSIRHTTSGRKKKTVRKNSNIRTITVSSQTRDAAYRRDTPDYPSCPDTTGVAAKIASPKYTGTLVKGIGTMHKSNAVPIIDEQHMKDIARMRR